MYKELTIKNIKIFKEEQKLKIAPITLLYGENSSGKTTLLKTFDIIHNIFSEQQVKRGKNVSQKDGTKKSEVKSKYKEEEFFSKKSKTKIVSTKSDTKQKDIH